MLFIRGGAVGDFILTLPAMQLVRETLPDVEIEVLGYESIAGLATSSGIAVETRSIEHGPLANFFVPGAELDPELKEYFASFSVVVSYLFDPDGFFAANLRRANVKHLIEASHRVDDQSLDARPAAQQLATPLESLAMYLEKPFVEMEFEEAAYAPASAVVAETEADDILIALHPGSGSPSKNWARKNWVEVAAALSKKNPRYRFIVVSGEAETEIIGDFLLQLNTAGVPWREARDLPLPALGAILKRCHLFLGHDSGMSHLAAACGTKCVLLFGPTRAEIWAPQNPLVRIVSSADGKLSSIRPEDALEQIIGAI